MTAAAQQEQELQQVNNQLVKLGFRRIGDRRWRQLCDHGYRPKLYEAINQAPNNHKAANWLKRVTEHKESGEEAPDSQAPTDNRGPDNQEGQSNDTPDGAQGAEGQKGPTAKDRKWRNYHVYGGKAAITVEMEETREGIPTLQIEAALAQGSKKYDWANKERFQLTKQELPDFAATLLGYRKQLKLENHGPNANKTLELQDQQDKYFLKILTPDQAYPLPIPLEEVFRIAAMALVQLRKSIPGLSGTDLQMALRQTVGRASNNR